MYGRVKITKKKEINFNVSRITEHLLGQVQPHSSKATKYKA